MTDDATPMRRIRSFVLRTGRMTAGQERGYEDNWPKWGLTSKAGLLDLKEVFGREGPCVFEIGFGMGHSLTGMAQAFPESNFIGVEVHTPGVGKLLSDMEEQSLDNIRVFREDANDVLNQSIADGALSKVQIFFPDPWHKTKHHKRRLVQPEFVQLLRRKLKVGGVIHLATDWENYAKHMMKVMSGAEGFTNQAGEGNYSERPEHRPLTKFEKRGHRLGHGVWDLLFEKMD